MPAQTRAARVARGWQSDTCPGCPVSAMHPQRSGTICKVGDDVGRPICHAPAQLIAFGSESQNSPDELCPRCLKTHDVRIMRVRPSSPNGRLAGDFVTRNTERRRWRYKVCTHATSPARCSRSRCEYRHACGRCGIVNVSGSVCHRGAVRGRIGTIDRGYAARNS